MLDIDATLHAFSHAVAAVATERDLVEAVGPDAATFLQGQLSQDVERLAVGESAASLLLQPQGKVDAWIRVTRLGPEHFWLDVEPGFGAAVRDRLNRFKIRVKVELTLSEGRPVLAVRGPAAGGGPAAVGLDPGAAVALAPVAEQDRGAGPGFDLVAPEGGGPPDAGPVPVGPAAALDGWRVRWGLPAMGRELDSSTIPAAAGVVEGSVSFTKGCYVGQELVSRIDSRGAATPTHLRGLRLAEAAELAGGETVEADGVEVGRVTSYAPVTGLGPLALAFCRRALEVPARAEVVDATGRRVAAEVVALPF